MSGSVRRRGAGWEWRTRSPEGREMSRGGFRTQRDAKDDLARKVAAMADGLLVEPDRLTVKQYLEDQWLPAVKTTVRASTAASYQGHVKRHLVPRIGSVRLQRLTRGQVNALYGELQTAERRGGGTLSPSTVRRIHATLHHALSDAVRWGLVSRNVSDLADLPRLARAQMNVWNGDQVRAFLDGAAAHRHYPLFRLLLMGGIRRGEALGLRWGDVDLGDGCIVIVQARSNYGAGEPKTRRSRRMIPLDPGTIGALKAWRDVQQAEREQWAECWTDTRYVFTAESGHPYHPDAITRSFDRLVGRIRKAQTEAKVEVLPTIRLHDLRHTHATMMLLSGTHPKVVSERLGHSSIGLTMDTYSHVLPGMQESAVARLAALVDGE